MKKEEMELYMTLLKGMVNLLKRKKYNDITKEELCEESNVSVETLDRYFKDKEDFTIKGVRYMYEMNEKDMNLLLILMNF